MRHPATLLLLALTACADSPPGPTTPIATAPTGPELVWRPGQHSFPGRPAGAGWLAGDQQHSFEAVGVEGIYRRSVRTALRQQGIPVGDDPFATPLEPVGPAIPEPGPRILVPRR